MFSDICCPFVWPSATNLALSFVNIAKSDFSFCVLSSLIVALIRVASDMETEIARVTVVEALCLTGHFRPTLDSIMLVLFCLFMLR